MAFREQTTLREPFLPREESERWPNTPAPEIATSKSFMPYDYSANGKACNNFFNNKCIIMFFSSYNKCVYIM